MDLCFLKNLKTRATTKSLVASITDAIDCGMLRKGERMPSSREIAAFTGTSRTTIVRAFDELIARGYLTGKKGQATYVAQIKAAQVISFSPEENHPTLKSTGLLPTELLPVREWQRCINRQFSDLVNADAQGKKRRSMISLKQAICGYLRRTEGILCAPANILVFTGTDRAEIFLTNLLSAHNISGENSDRAIIIENASGSEFQYSAKASPSLFSRDDTDNVVYHRSLAGLLQPLIKLELVIVPDNLLPELNRIRPNGEVEISLEQAALTEFIEEGSLEKHIRATWKVLRRRRQALIYALKQCFDRRIEIFASHAGTQIVVSFNEMWKRSEVLNAGRRAGLTIFENEVAKQISDPFVIEYKLDFSAIDENEVQENIDRFAKFLNSESTPHLVLPVVEQYPASAFTSVLQTPISTYSTSAQQTSSP